MKRILFVDDEPRILEGLQRTLRSRREEWAMAFAVGGEAACTQLAVAPFDVIVTDMRMPEVDGVAVLTHVKAKYPHMIRIVLSGHADGEATVRAIALAHQFLLKPCDMTLLSAAIQRTCALKDLLRDEAIRKLVGEIGALPTAPKVYTELTNAMSRDDVGIEQIARVVEQDVALSAKILQLANSSFFGLPRKLGSISMAINYLGLQTLRSIALSMEIFSGQAFEMCTGRFEGDAFQTHSVTVGRLAQRLMDSREDGASSFAAGLLHDAGHLILLSRFPDRFREIRAVATTSERPLHEVEREYLGVTHAEMGAYLLGLWDLPYPVVEAVAFHHQPSRVVGRDKPLPVCGAVHVANVLAHEIDRYPSRLDEDYLRGLGMVDRLPQWRTLAAEVHSQG